MGKNECLPVWFNKEHRKLYDGIKKSTSLSFKEFVKSAFHDKIDKIKREANTP